jgi:hypothetical protein
MPRSMTYAVKRAQEGQLPHATVRRRRVLRDKTIPAGNWPANATEANSGPLLHENEARTDRLPALLFSQPARGRQTVS